MSPVVALSKKHYIWLQDTPTIRAIGNFHPLFYFLSYFRQGKSSAATRTHHPLHIAMKLKHLIFRNSCLLMQAINILSDDVI
jgi:hypothetical protein